MRLDGDRLHGPGRLLVDELLETVLDLETEGYEQNDEDYDIRSVELDHGTVFFVD